jgi:hypothetical protein
MCMFKNVKNVKIYCTLSVFYYTHKKYTIVFFIIKLFGHSNIIYVEISVQSYPKFVNFGSKNGKFRSHIFYFYILNLNNKRLLKTETNMIYLI